jgi:hypothetical protein
MVIHAFGDNAKFHPHLHAIIADGLLRPNGTFYCLPKRDLKEAVSACMPEIRSPGTAYILRNAFLEQKVTYIEDTGKVLYRTGMTHGSKKKNSEIFSAKEFIAAVTQHIRDKHFQVVRYCGWHSCRSRGERIKAGLFMPGDEPTFSAVSPEVTVLDVSEHRPRRVPSKTWRELIKRNSD